MTRRSLNDDTIRTSMPYRILRGNQTVNWNKFNIQRRSFLIMCCPFSCPEFIPGAQPDNFGATSAGYDYKPYGPPAQSYGPPAQSYGPVQPTYGPPHFPQHPTYPVYGPPPTQAARGDWLWDKFHFKFDLLTLGKILIKLLIFKKIVKFFGVICLLMFLPTLIEKKKAQSDEQTDGFGEEMFRNLKPIGGFQSWTIG